MIVELLILIITTLLGYYFYSYKRIQWLFKEKGVKYLPGVPFFGNVIKSTFFRRHFLYDLDDVYKAFPDERYVGFQEFTLPIILIRDPELIKTIVVKDFDHFTDHREFVSEDIDPVFAGSLFFMKGERWRQMRATLSPAFTGSKMKYMLPLISDITNNIVKYLYGQQGINIDVDDLMRRYTNDVIASAGFGYHVNSLKERNNEFYKMGTGIFEFNLRQKLTLILSTQFPALTKKLGLRLFPDNTIYNFFSNLITSTIEYRKKENVERPDMIQLLIEAKRDWTPDELTGQVSIFFFAGFETSASALVMTIHELAINPDVQERLYQECRSFKKDREFTFENMSDLKYLNAVLNESLRKWTPTIIMDRTCTKAYELPPPSEGGKPYKVKPGDIVYNIVNSIQMDPKYWPDPHKYEPERFLGHKIEPFTFMPFGAGPRACIGVRFAMMTLKMLLYNLVLNMKIVKAEKTSETIELKPHDFNMRAIDGTFVQFERRMSE